MIAYASSTRSLLVRAGLPLLLLPLLPITAAGETLSGHGGQIKYDTEAQEYILKDIADPVPAAEVERSLSTALCGQCHVDAVAQLKASVHFSVQAPNPRILFPGGGAHGALDRACGLPGTSALINYNSDINLGECGKCHVGRFIPPMEGAFTSLFSQMGLPDPAGQAQALVDGGLDCLICHAEHYLSVRDDLDWLEKQVPLMNTHQIAGYAEPGAPSPSPEGYANLYRDNTDFDHDGAYDLLIDVTGDSKPDMCLPIGFNPDGSPICGWPTVGQDRSADAVLSVGKTDEHGCLRCHEHARTGYKRGTLFRVGYDAHANVCFPNPSLTADDPNCPQHNTCTACHVTLNQDYDGDGLEDVHKFVRGHLVGGDLAAADYPPPAPGVRPDPNDPTHLTCVQCHDAATLPQKGSPGKPGVHSDSHLQKIACETCHITRSGGITYSMYGHGGHISFGRNEDGLDTKVITYDHMVADGDTEAEVDADVDADFAAYEIKPVLMWFDGMTSFLAQSLAVRPLENVELSANAKIVPFKPMANGMVMDGRFFAGDTQINEAGFPYNKYSMYRFFANAISCDGLGLPEGMCGSDGLYGNAEVFSALKLLGTVTDNQDNVIVEGLTPAQTRQVTIKDLFEMGQPSLQTMAMMQAFPNLMNFSKSGYQYEHYLISTELAGAPEDADGDGILDEGAPFLFDMLGAVNTGLEEFKGFNMPMLLPPDYDWYPPFDSVENVATMKLPDGSFMKLFLAMQLQGMEVPMDQIQQRIGNYPAFSNGVTLGGHGIAPNPKQNALGGPGRSGCTECHSEGGVLTTKVPVTRKTLVDLPFEPPMNVGEMPIWRWVYYNVRGILDLGLKTSNEDVLAGIAHVDIAGNTDYMRTSDQQMVLNWFAPAEKPRLNGKPLEDYLSFTPADSQRVLKGTSLKKKDLTWNGGDWMPVLEPVTDAVPNYAVLGYMRDEVIFNTSGGVGGGGPGPGRN